MLTSIRQLLQAADLLKIRTVDEVMTADVIQAPPTATVLELAQLMAENSVSCVVITNVDSQPISIVTERDIDLHKGFISVNSQVGIGTTFTVKIPLQ